MTALVVGIMMVALADTFIREKRPKVTRRETRTFSPGTPKSLVGIYMLGAALLLAANDGPDSYPRPPNEDWGESGGSTERVQFEDGRWGYHYPDAEDSAEYRAYGKVDGGDGNRDIYDTDAFDNWDERDG